MTAFTRWANEQPEAEPLKLVSRRLKTTVTLPEGTLTQQAAEKEQQIVYTFEEWTKLQSRENNELLPTFLHQLHKSRTLATRDDYILFVRVCLETAMASFEDETRKGSIDGQFVKLDALAKLVVLLVAYQGSINGSVRVEKAEYFSNMLITLCLLFNKYHMSGINNAQRMFFRTFASIISELQATTVLGEAGQRDLATALGRALAFVRPQAIPSFAFAYLGLLSHRLFMPTVLKPAHAANSRMYCELLVHHLDFVTEQIRSVEVSRPAKELYRGTMELFLVLHHDYPEFLAKYHFQLLNAIPSRCIQMRSLIISATPSTSAEGSESSANGLTGEAAEDTKAVLLAQESIEKTLQDADISWCLDECMTSSEKGSRHADRIIEAIERPSNPRVDLVFHTVPVDLPLLHAVVLRTALRTEHESAASNITFDSNSPMTYLLDLLVEKLGPETRHFLLDTIVDQLRWNNYHTNYFGMLIFHLFRTRSDEKLTQDVQMQIARTFLERLIAHRPHPWGLMATMEELFKNRQYRFWELPFIKATPEVSLMFLARAPNDSRLTDNT